MRMTPGQPRFFACKATKAVKVIAARAATYLEMMFTGRKHDNFDGLNCCIMV